MEDLLKQLIFRAESQGGEEWLRKCLQQGPDQQEELLLSSNPVCCAVPGASAELIDPPCDNFVRMREKPETRSPIKKRQRRDKRAYSPSQYAPPSKTKKTNLSSSRASRKIQRRHFQQHSTVTQEPSPASTVDHPPTSSASGPSKVVWIFGDELIQLAERRSAFRHSTVNLGYSAEFSINWFSFADLKISDIFKNVSLIYSKMSKPDLFILHIGSFDLGKIKTHLLIYELKELLCKICYLLDGVVLVFSDIIPKFSWFNSELSFLETIRKRINKKLEIYLKEIGHGNYRHVELEGFVRGLYQEKDDQLSDIGCDIFISDLQNIIDNGFY
ncbi:uncharacterized protein LOC122919345 isoform X1 [Bufo gargarizans]|uniref:uncharacterized protein LOC122919345 isoform X1 n=1 Tax=Bufo gargarizans TaxID=30331 RepID=UPI001CF45E3A|nr:uncharacterized protein LOC122919345 isoform X1 [Bufo gargarizans]